MTGGGGDSKMARDWGERGTIVEGSLFSTSIRSNILLRSCHSISQGARPHCCRHAHHFHYGEMAEDHSSRWDASEILPHPHYSAAQMVGGNDGEGISPVWTLSGATSPSRPDERGSLLSALAFSLPPSCLLGLHISSKIILPVLGSHFGGSPVF